MCSEHGIREGGTVKLTDHNYVKTRLQHGCMEEGHAQHVANIALH